MTTSASRALPLPVSPRAARGLGLALAAATAVLLFLASGALGIVGGGGRADRAYVAVPAVLVLGSALARLRPAGMVLALGATALTLVVVSASLLLAGVGGPDASTLDVLGVTAFFALGFLGAAGLFRRA